MDVLAGYATAHGSTRAVAERMTAVLRRAGLTAQARPMADVEDADAYRAFVLGSAVHGQRRLLAAEEFVRENLDVLGSRPVWIFSAGMPAAPRGPWRRMAPREVPAIEDGLPRGCAYRDHRLFSGAVSRDQLPRAGRLMFRLMGGRFGDFRDRDAVEAWTTGIAEELRTVTGHGRGP